MDERIACSGGWENLFRLVGGWTYLGGIVVELMWGACGWMGGLGWWVDGWYDWVGGRMGD